MKRATSNQTDKQRKKSRVKIARTQQQQQLKESQSVGDEAEQFRLGTARFPIDALTAEWTLGRNRKIDPAHKQGLVQLFRDQGIRRKDAECRIRVACTKEQFQRMLEHLDIPGINDGDDAGRAPARPLV